MPRIPTSLLVKARAEHPLLARLLPTCRDLPSARDELRWLTEHVLRLASTPAEQQNINGNSSEQRKKEPSSSVSRQLKKLCSQRGRGKPLQYILGSEFFGELEIQCRAGVLIPRPETAEIVTELVCRLAASSNQAHLPPSKLRVLDLCTGTGCMSLLFQHELRKKLKPTPTVFGLGVDISRKAIALAKANHKKLTQEHESFDGSLDTLDFVHANVLETGASQHQRTTPTAPPSLLSVLKRRDRMSWDILLANPPYISPSAFYTETARSVRNFEPRLALVPPSTTSSCDEDRGSPMVAGKTAGERRDHARADLFYPRILKLAAELHVKLVLVEVGDTAQALRVARAAMEEGVWSAVEVWRDGIGNVGCDVLREEVVVDLDETRKRAGEGGMAVVKGPTVKTAGRAVVCWRDEAEEWMAA